MIQQIAGKVDERAFGRLEQSVEHLSSAVDALTTAVTELSGRIEKVEGRYTFGRGTALGIALAAALAMYGVNGLIDKLLGIVAK